jgi:hypothetical protein
VSGRQDESVAVDPTGLVRVVAQGVSVKDGPDLSRAQREAEVPGVAGVDSVNGKAARDIRSLA